MKDTLIIMYGTSWCGHTRRSRKLLEEYQVPYTWIDIDINLDGRRFVESINHGMRSVPTIVFPDGTILVEPSDRELTRKLGLAGND